MEGEIYILALGVLGRDLNLGDVSGGDGMRNIGGDAMGETSGDDGIRDAGCDDEG